MKRLISVLLCLCMLVGCSNARPVPRETASRRPEWTRIEPTPTSVVDPTKAPDRTVTARMASIERAPTTVVEPTEAPKPAVAARTASTEPTPTPSVHPTRAPDPTVAASTASIEPTPIPTVHPTEAPEPTATAKPVSQETESVEPLDLTQLWSYGLTSIRTGEPLIREGGEHKVDESVVSYGYNLVVDEDGNVLTPRGTPLQGGERLILTEDYQDDHNVREYARIYTIVAPIRDTILYRFEETTREEWLAITEILTINNLKTEDAAEINGRSILSTRQVYDYIASGNAEGSPVMRYLEEAGLELKCLAFKEFDFTNPEGGNHCEEQDIEVGSGIELP